jgi:hypothetical protein
MRYPVVALLLASLLLSGPVRSDKDAALTINLIQLLPTPDKFDHKTVTVRGYLQLDQQPQHSPPSAYLFLHVEDAENMLGNVVVIQPTDPMLRNAERIDRMYVILTGTVRVTHLENGGVILGIGDVQRCDPWSDSHPPARPKGRRKQTQVRRGNPSGKPRDRNVDEDGTGTIFIYTSAGKMGEQVMTTAFGKRNMRLRSGSNQGPIKRGNEFLRIPVTGCQRR